jgi:hypothetical protein
MQKLPIRALEPVSDEDRYRLVIGDSGGLIPTTAISGYPLILDSREVWQGAIEEAWDPKLVYYVGDLFGVGQGEIRVRVQQAHASKKELVRHGLTILGLNAANHPMVVVVEESPTESRGVSLGEAAQIMKSVGVHNAIVLGGKGDVQLVSTLEGVIACPFVATHDLDWARPVDNLNYKEYIVPRDARERPVPGFAGFEYLKENYRSSK